MIVGCHACRMVFLCLAESIPEKASDIHLELVVVVFIRNLKQLYFSRRPPVDYERYSAKGCVYENS